MTNRPSSRVPSDTGTPDPLADFLCFSVYSAGLAFNRAYKPILDRLGLTYLQYLAIVALTDQTDLTVGELGGRLDLESSTLTPLLKRLEAAGFVTRRRDPADERVVRIALTPAGRALAEEARCVPSEIGKSIGLSAQQLDTLNGQIKLLRANLRDSAA
jgi:DNA-binding MarR family transcriptional regulator